jgi:quercetin dioxygenase-like cupin family protein
MAIVGESIENPLSGERITWVETAASSRGEVLAFDLEMQQGAAVAAEHRHLAQEERFAVTAGSINVSIDGAERTLSAGETAVVPPGVAHRWSNVAAERAVVRVELRPALESEVFFETLFGWRGMVGRTRRVFLACCRSRSPAPISATPARVLSSRRSRSKRFC